MILIADSGATATKWLISGDGRNETLVTSGINPFYVDGDRIVESLRKEFLVDVEASEVFFYGAGCTEENRHVVRSALAEFFGSARVLIYSDMLGAARALFGSGEGIACVLGTGSNSCIYDGKDIVENIPPLGLILGDEGSGANIGKRLVAAALRNRLPEAVRNRIFAICGQEKIMGRVYRHSFPNRFLAQFAPVAGLCLDCEEVSTIVEDSFSAFVEQQVLPYGDLARLRLGFTGSIACHFAHTLRKVLHKYGLEMAIVMENSLKGLAAYHSVSYK
ncbi:MAG: ATPase [Dysgonamonadaceae bacterium]|jgi:N-acetylglucosamine kinase-like BadF-type ATPase|nr:ATPase [Dysgonamonadaceae bacterium]